MGIDTVGPLGALLIDKPAGPTSHDVVAFIRRTLKIARAGHTGTLDPLATGLLVVLVGHATRLAQFLAADEKEYIADVRLGIATATYDAQSLDNHQLPTPNSQGTPPGSWELEAGSLEKILARFRGTFLQIPPPFSAKKIASVPAYEKARKNQAVDLKPVQVTVRGLEVIDLRPGAAAQGPRDRGLVRLRLVASAGFYVRSLAHDLGQALGCGAHLEALRRTRAGRFDVAAALPLDQIEARGAGAVIPPNALLADLPAVTLTAEGARRAGHGNPLGPRHLENGDSPRFGNGDRSSFNGDCPRFRVVDPAGTLLAVAERRADGLLHPLVVLR